MTYDLRTQQAGAQNWVSLDLVNALNQAVAAAGRSSVNPGLYSAYQIASRNGLVTSRKEFDNCIMGAGGIKAVIDTLTRCPAGKYSDLFPKPRIIL